MFKECIFYTNKSMNTRNENILLGVMHSECIMMKGRICA